MTAVNASPASLHLCRFSKDELIFAEASQGNCAYILESGRVQIFVTADHQRIPLKVLEPGDIFGEMAVIDASPRSASAIALSDCTCIAISQAQIAERIHDSDPVVKLLISILLRRTREQNTRLKTNHSPGASPSLSPSLSPPLRAVAMEDEQRLMVLEKIKLEVELKAALDRGDLVPYYQPLVNLHTQTIVGFEALIRWYCPSRGMVNPAMFIELAEETSLIRPIGLAILEASCHDLSLMQTVYPRRAQSQPLFISVNVSVKQIQEPDFVDQLTTLIQRHGLQPSQIKLEVTERIFLAAGTAIQTIQRCRRAGFQVSLDDFGTGFSSLNYIARCEFDSIKVDQSFVHQMFANQRTLVLMDTIIQLSRRLEMVAFAEGIETVHQMETLRDLGCHIGQGYLFGKPMTLKDTLALLAAPGGTRYQPAVLTGDSAC